MNPDDIERFESSLKDLDVFIAGFEKKSSGPDGHHYKEPLARLKNIRESINFLKSGSYKIGPGLRDEGPLNSAAISKLVSKLISTNQKNFKAIRSDLSSVAELTGKIKPTVKRMEGMSSQILSLGRVSMEAADKLKKLVKESQTGPTKEAPALDPKVIETFADKIAEGIQKLELKVNAIGRGISKVDKDISGLPQQIDDQGDNFEVNFAAIESKVSGLLERADMGGLLDKLEPRLRNSEDGLKVLLDRVRDMAAVVADNHKVLKEDKSEETVELLESILDRQSAIESLSMVLTPLSQSYQDLSNSMKASPLSKLPEEFAEQFEELCERVDRNEELLEKILDRQSAIESLSMVLHPLSQSFKELSAKFEEESKVDEKIDALSRQVSALQAMVRNTYRKADKALASQPSANLSKADLQTMAGFEKPGPVAALEESEEMPWYVPKDAKGKKKKAKEVSEDKAAENSEESSAGPKEEAKDSESPSEDGPVDLDAMDLGLNNEKASDTSDENSEKVDEQAAKPEESASDQEPEKSEEAKDDEESKEDEGPKREDEPTEKAEDAKVEPNEQGSAAEKASEEGEEASPSESSTPSKAG